MPRTNTSVMKILKGDGKHNPYLMYLNSFDSFAPTRGRDKSNIPPSHPEFTTSKPDLALTSADTSVKVTVLLLT